ncbi:hypothetical protein JAAARDRAFT_138401 [Jaapia argillacea MUCL 33604]|uniref:FHA domain-containing protein n=1 Tax=Jaapia argillacea MUCL 33604 TaxID=933084 RepID=A0A067PMP2_9AGAM|nr:hypothetical protein JAAARDRAFT_138401 [Jaapia argillacea MUCL 33604]
MWLITGPFDGEVVGDTSFSKTKLLKTGRQYVIGRKEQLLIVNHKKISRDHVIFIVDSYSSEDVTNPPIAPKLKIHHCREKGNLSVTRGAELLPVEIGASLDLQDGDVVNLVTGVTVRWFGSVKWLRVCCFATSVRGRPSIPVDTCARLGEYLPFPLCINIVYSCYPDVTHHLTPAFSASALIATSLLSASHIVKPEWLDELLRLGELEVPTGSMKTTSLEHAFVLPAEAKFRPSFSPSLPPTMKVFKVWEPDEARLNFFHGYRFLFLGEKGREVNMELKDLVVRGGGEYEGFNIGNGRAKWHQTLVKGVNRIGADKKGLVPVASESALLTSIGKEKLDELVEETKS